VGRYPSTPGDGHRGLAPLRPRRPRCARTARRSPPPPRAPRGASCCCRTWRRRTGPRDGQQRQGVLSRRSTGPSRFGSLSTGWRDPAAASFSCALPAFALRCPVSVGSSGVAGIGPPPGVALPRSLPTYMVGLAAVPDLPLPLTASTPFACVLNLPWSRSNPCSMKLSSVESGHVQVSPHRASR
jgi:hypothetical protein